MKILWLSFTSFVYQLSVCGQIQLWAVLNLKMEYEDFQFNCSWFAVVVSVPAQSQQQLVELPSKPHFSSGQQQMASQIKLFG